MPAMLCRALHRLCTLCCLVMLGRSVILQQAARRLVQAGLGLSSHLEAQKGRGSARPVGQRSQS